MSSDSPNSYCFIGKVNCQLIGALTSANQADPEKFDDNPNTIEYIGMTATVYNYYAH